MCIPCELLAISVGMSPATISGMIKLLLSNLSFRFRTWWDKPAVFAVTVAKLNRSNR
jgi:hypothetical protein